MPDYSGIENDLQLMVNTIHDTISVLNDIINLVKDTRMLIKESKNISIKYCIEVFSREAY